MLGGLEPPPPLATAMQDTWSRLALVPALGWEVHPGRQIFTYNFDFTPRIHHFFQNFSGGMPPDPLDRLRTFGARTKRSALSESSYIIYIAYSFTQATLTTVRDGPGGGGTRNFGKNKIIRILFKKKK